MLHVLRSTLARGDCRYPCVRRAVTRSRRQVSISAPAWRESGRSGATNVGNVDGRGNRRLDGGFVGGSVADVVGTEPAGQAKHRGGPAVNSSGSTGKAIGAGGRVTIVGAGTMGRAFLYRLRCIGSVLWTIGPVEPDELVAAGMGTPGGSVFISLLRSGSCTWSRMKTGAIARGCTYVDLCTQSIADCRRTMAEADARGVLYCGGGVLGGGRELMDGKAQLLAGGSISPLTERVLSSVGRLTVFARPEQACAAKLLHNFVVLLSNHAIAAALALAEESGIEGFDKLLDAGISGRRPSETSVVRDRSGTARSTYTSLLVRKDIEAILDSFGRLQDVGGFGLPYIARLHGPRDPAPYSVRALRILEGMK